MGVVWFQSLPVSSKTQKLSYTRCLTDCHILFHPCIPSKCTDLQHPRKASPFATNYLMERLNNQTATQHCTPYSFTGVQTVLQDFGLQIGKMNNKDTFTFTQTVMHSFLPRTFCHEIENTNTDKMAFRGAT